MRSSRSAKRCLWGSSSPAPSPCQFLYHRPRRQIPAVHAFSTTRSLPRRSPSHKSISQDDWQRILQERLKNYASYTEAEKKELARHYTPEQLAAIEAGEEAVSTEDLATQGRFRGDPLAFRYLEDFSTIDPVVDKRITKLRGEGEDYDKVTNFADFEDADEKMAKIADAMLEPDPGKPLGAFDSLWNKATTKFDDVKISNDIGQLLESPHEMNAEQTEALLDKVANSQNEYDPDVPFDEMTARMDAQRNTLPHSSNPNDFTPEAFDQLDRIIDWEYHPSPPSVAPTLPKISDPNVSFAPPSNPNSPDEDEETRALFSLLSKQTGHSIQTLRRFRVKTLVAHRVVNQTRLGKIQSMYFLTVAGNQDGLLGIGEGKATEPEDARRAAMLSAIRNMRPVARYENRTIFGTVRGKSGAVKLELSARPPGFGVRTQHLIFEMARCAGISDLAGKVGKARNKMNVCKAAWQALLGQQDVEELARARGRKFVDVRKVYYAGEV